MHIYIYIVYLNVFDMSKRSVYIYIIYGYRTGLCFTCANKTAETGLGLGTRREKGAS